MKIFIIFYILCFTIIHNSAIYECGHDSDCSAGYCVDGKCSDIVNCAVDSDCAIHQHCYHTQNHGHMCLKDMDLAILVSDECINNTHCPDGQYCEKQYTGNICIEKNTDTISDKHKDIKHFSTKCTTNDDCNHKKQVCNGSLCVIKSNQNCLNDSDCKNERICYVSTLGSFCILQQLIDTPGHPCVTDCHGASEQDVKHIIDDSNKNKKKKNQSTSREFIFSIIIIIVPTCCCCCIYQILIYMLKENLNIDSNNISDNSLLAESYVGPLNNDEYGLECNDPFQPCNNYNNYNISSSPSRTLRSIKMKTIITNHNELANINPFGEDEEDNNENDDDYYEDGNTVSSHASEDVVLGDLNV